MSESAFWKAARRRLSGEFHLVRVESGATSPGIPDVHFVRRGSGESGWVELKESARADHGDLAALVRPAQAAWHYEYRAAGGNSWVLARLGPLVWLWDGRLARRLREPGGFGACAPLRAVSGPAEDPGVWRALAERLPFPQE